MLGSFSDVCVWEVGEEDHGSNRDVRRTISLSFPRNLSVIIMLMKSNRLV
jgi:hypothetical protein